MIYIKVPKEIKDYEDKLVGGMSLRQLVFFMIAGIMAIIVYFLLSGFLNQQIISYIIIILVFPIVCFGWVEKNGMKFDKYVMLIINFHSRRQKLHYSDEYQLYQKKDFDKKKSKKTHNRKTKRKKSNEFDEF